MSGPGGLKYKIYERLRHQSVYGSKTEFSFADICSRRSVCFLPHHLHVQVYPVRRSLLGLLRKQKGSISILDSQSNGQEQRWQATLQFLEKKKMSFCSDGCVFTEKPLTCSAAMKQQTLFLCSLFVPHTSFLIFDTVV